MAASDERSDSVWRWPPPLGLLWLVLPVAGMTLRVGFGPVPPHDYWWQLAFGRMIAETGTIPHENLFLYTLPAGARFVDQPWLAQWALYRLVEQFGHAGPYVVRAGLTAGVWAGLVWLARSRCGDARAVGGVALAAVVVSAGVFSVRSRLFALPLYVGMLGLVVAVAERWLRARWLALLIPVVVLWANVHGSFVLAPVLTAIVGISLLTEQWFEGRSTWWQGAWPWAGAVVAAVVAGCATPIGVEIYAYVVDIAFSSRVTETVTEWQPPDPTNRYGAFVWASIVGGAVVLAVRRKSVRIWEGALYAATAYLALSAVRSVFWWGAVAVVVLPRHVAALLPSGEETREEPSMLEGLVHAGAVGVLVVATVAIQPGMPGFGLRSAVIADKTRSSPPGAYLLSSRTPLGVVERLREADVSGRIFHDQAVGGLLEYELGAAEPSQPRQVAFVDQRMGLIPPEVWADYFAISRAEEGWRAKLKKWGVGALLLYEKEQGALIEAVGESDAWRRVGREDGHVLFLRP